MKHETQEYKKPSRRSLCHLLESCCLHLGRGNKHLALVCRTAHHSVDQRRCCFSRCRSVSRPAEGHMPHGHAPPRSHPAVPSLLKVHNSLECDEPRSACKKLLLPDPTLPTTITRCPFLRVALRRSNRTGWPSPPQETCARSRRIDASSTKYFAILNNPLSVALLSTHFGSSSLATRKSFRRRLLTTSCTVWEMSSATVLIGVRNWLKSVKDTKAISGVSTFRESIKMNVAKVDKATCAQQTHSVNYDERERERRS